MNVSSEFVTPNNANSFDNVLDSLFFPESSSSSDQLSESDINFEDCFNPTEKDKSFLSTISSSRNSTTLKQEELQPVKLFRRTMINESLTKTLLQVNEPELSPLEPELAARNRKRRCEKMSEQRQKINPKRSKVMMVSKDKVMNETELKELRKLRNRESSFQWRVKSKQLVENLRIENENLVEQIVNLERQMLEMQQEILNLRCTR